MAILSIFKPGPTQVGGDDDHWVTQDVNNPWGQSDVWIQCTTKYVAGDGQSDFGIYQIQYLDANGQLQTQTFGGDDVYGTLMDAYFVQRMLRVTVAAHTFDAAIEGTLTLFQWG